MYLIYCIEVSLYSYIIPKHIDDAFVSFWHIPNNEEVEVAVCEFDWLINGLFG
jgi:hypothetical protein